MLDELAVGDIIADGLSINFQNFVTILSVGRRACRVGAVLAGRRGFVWDETLPVSLLLTLAPRQQFRSRACLCLLGGRSASSRATVEMLQTQ